MTYPTTTSNAVVALSFCSLLEQGAKDAPRTAGDWGWNVKPQSADMPPNVLRGIACDNFGHGLFDFILLWHYSCARQNIASVLNIFISLRLMPPAFAGLEIASSMARSTTKSSSNNSTILSIASSMARSTTKSNSNSSNNQQQQ